MANKPAAPKTTVPEPQALRATAAFLAAVGEPTRLRIVRTLAGGARNVTEIATALNVEIVNISHHLGVMRTAGVVSDEKDGRFVLYKLVSSEATAGELTVHGPGVSVSLSL